MLVENPGLMVSDEQFEKGIVAFLLPSLSIVSKRLISGRFIHLKDMLKKNVTY
jgi:hypothetical protein